MTVEGVTDTCEGIEGLSEVTGGEDDRCRGNDGQ